MRFIKFLSVFVLLTVSKFAIAQIVDLATASFPFTPKENGVILVNYNQPTTIRAAFTVSRILSGPSGTWPDLPIKAEIALSFYNTDFPSTVIDVINVSASDWYGPQYTVSKVIEKDIVIPAGAVTLAKPNSSIKVAWRFYKQGYPSPYNTDGWTDWVDKYYDDMKLNPNQIPQTAFTGPNSVCDEGIYTITNPYTVSLENASGIATLTALGNNQWKVTRTGTANGVVKLRSTFNGKIFEKEIMIGGSLAIGFDNLNNMQAFNHEYFKVLPGTGNLKYSGSMTITNLNSTGHTDYKWSLVSKSPGNPIVSWSGAGPNLSVSSKGSGGWVNLKCEITNGCAQETRYYKIYVGIDPLMP